MEPERGIGRGGERQINSESSIELKKKKNECWKLCALRVNVKRQQHRIELVLQSDSVYLLPNSQESLQHNKFGSGDTYYTQWRLFCENVTQNYMKIGCAYSEQNKQHMLTVDASNRPTAGVDKKTERLKHEKGNLFFHKCFS